MLTTKAHCNECGGERNHYLLHSTAEQWAEGEVHGHDTYQTLKCCGCDTITLRHISWFSEEDEAKVYYFPPAMFRKPPEWFDSLWEVLEPDEGNIGLLLREVYVAIQNDLPSLAAMGVRALLENLMVQKTGDHGSFNRNLNEFERLGHLSTRQRERLETILEAGHAAIHRAFRPKTTDIVTLLDITEHIIESVFLHDPKVHELKERIPPRADLQGG